MYILWLFILCLNLGCSIFYPSSGVTGTVYSYIPETLISFCTRKLNATGQAGCSSKVDGNTGVVLFCNSSAEHLETLRLNNDTDYVLILDIDMFVNTSFMYIVRSKPNVVGVVVFMDIFGSRHKLPKFSESSQCPNSLYSYYSVEKQCNVGNKWNTFGSDYSSLDWPFPVVLIRDSNLTIRNELFTCYENFNVQSKDDTRCKIEIMNPMSAIGSTEMCVRRQNLMSLQIFANPEYFCDDLTGLNIVLATNNGTPAQKVNQVHDSKSGSRLENSSLVVITRTDSRSMFERSGFSSQGVLPSVAVLLSTIVHLINQPVIKNFEFKKDLFFVFVDNEAYDLMGSQRLSFDLKWSNLARYTGIPLGWENVYAVLELGEIGLAKQNSQLPTYYLLSDSGVYNATNNVTQLLYTHLMSASNVSGQVKFKPFPITHDYPLPPTASLQSLLRESPKKLPHVLVADHAGAPLLNDQFESFLDVYWPPEMVTQPDNQAANFNLLNLANTLADAIYRIITDNNRSIDSSITYPAPGDFMECFVNNTVCDLMKQFLSPGDIIFLQRLNTPIPTQSYLPFGQHELKLSHLVNVLLMGLTGQKTSTSSCPPPEQRVPYSYIMGYFNGSEQCYRTLLDLASGFVSFKGDKPAGPAWLKSRVVSQRYVRWYRSTSPSVDSMSVVFGVLFITLTSVLVMYINEAMNAPIINPNTKVEIPHSTEDGRLQSTIQA